MNEETVVNSPNDQAQVNNLIESSENQQDNLLAREPDGQLSLEEDLAKKREEKSKAEENISSLQTAIKVLETRIAEFNQATTGYDTFYSDSTNQLTEVKTKIAEKKRMAQSVIDETVAKDIDKKINKQINDFESDLTQKKKQLSITRNALNTARTVSAEADSSLYDQQSAFTLLKKQPKEIKSALQNLQNLLVEAEKAHDQDDHSKMYLLVQIATSLSNKIVIPELDKYKQSLLDAQNDVEKTKADVAIKKADAEQKLKEISALIKAYEVRIESKQSDLLNLLRAINPANE